MLHRMIRTLARRPLWLAAGLALALQLDQRWHFPNLYLDTEVQMGAAASWLAGRGFASPEAAPDAPENIRYRSARIFMPGYAAVLAGFRLAGAGWLQAVWLADALSLLVLLSAMAVLLSGWGGAGEGWRAMGLLYLGASPAPLHYLPGSDLLMLSLFAWMAVCLLRERHAAALLLALACAWARSAGLVLLALPLLWLLMRRPLPAAKRAVLLAAASLGALLSTRLWSAGEESLLDQAGFQLFPAHWRWWEPLGWKAFIYYGQPHELQLAALHPAAPGLLRAAGWAATLLLGWIWLQGWRAAPALRAPVRLTLLVLGLICGMLGALSLLSPPETWNDAGFWTYVMETRYYAPALLLIVALSFALAGWESRFPGRLLLRAALLPVLCSMLLLSAAVHVLARAAPERLPVVARSPAAQLYRLLEAELPPGEPAWVCSPLDTRIADALGAAMLPWAAAQDSLLRLPSVHLYVWIPDSLAGRGSIPYLDNNPLRMNVLNGNGWQLLHLPPETLHAEEKLN
ncbi:MAG: hypothetical protein NW241_22365 [Bacteroidia bacterium]|nr:hypothetical protein [Bacteroidia bacterium]